MPEVLLDGKVELHCGDSLKFLKDIPDRWFDSIVTDPPYALVSIVKRLGSDKAAPIKAPVGGTGAYARASAGFMGKRWDTGETAFAVEFWAQCLRVLKPGGHVVAFGGTRTYHRLACAIEDAGFEIRDQLGYIYGSGFPKSHNISKAIGVCVCEALPERGVRSVRDSHVSAAEHAGEECGEILLSSMPEQGASVAGRQEHADHVRGGKPSMEGRSDVSKEARKLRKRSIREVPGGFDLDGANRHLRNGASVGDGEMGWEGTDQNGMCPSSRPQAAEQSEVQPRTLAGQSEPQVGGTWENCDRCGKPLVPTGLGTALKPAWEPIVLARKPLERSLTVAENVLQHGVGALNIDGCRIASDEVITNHARSGEASVLFGANKAQETYQSTGQALGRWPANLVHDGSEEVIAAFSESDGQNGVVDGQTSGRDVYGEYGPRPRMEPRGDSGSAARFFASFPFSDKDMAWTKHVNSADGCLSLRSAAVVSALANAAAASMQRLALCAASYLARDTSVSVQQLEQVETLLTATILSLEKRFVRGLPLEKLSLSSSLANVAAMPERTGTITITINLSKSNGFVEVATFECTETNSAVGEPALSGKRFHYTSKADADDRLGSKHPTVKPVDLMQWLVRLVTPKGGLVLDPFAGTGTTAEACFREGMRCMLVERETEYQADIRRRMSLVLGGPEERRRESVKAKMKDQPIDAGPLFTQALDSGIT